MKYIQPVQEGIVRFGTNHPNPRLRGLYLRFLKSPEELKILFANFLLISDETAFYIKCKGQTKHRTSKLEKTAEESMKLVREDYEQRNLVTESWMTIHDREYLDLQKKEKKWRQ